MLEVILRQSFLECVSNLVFCVNREYLDYSLVHMFAKNDASKHLCAWSLGIAWEALQVPEHLSCRQIPCGIDRAQYK
jgi:hypothetical protein